METDRGLGSVPRGLDRGLTQYLQSVDAALRRLTGTVRGSGKSRAVRASEASSFGGTGGGSSPSVDIGAIASQVLRDGSVTERKLVDGSVTDSKIRDNAVTARTIAPGAVGDDALRTGAVSSGKIAEKAVTSEKLVDGSVSTEKVANRAITSEKLAPKVVTTDKIALGAVTDTILADQSVTAEKLAAGVLPPAYMLVSGEAADGDTVTIPGVWAYQPTVMLTWFESVAKETFREETDENGEIVSISLHTTKAGAVNIHEKGDAVGVWLFEAVGRFAWVAVGRF